DSVSAEKDTPHTLTATTDKRETSTMSRRHDVKHVPSPYTSHVGNPPVAGGAVVLVLRLQLLKELSDVHAGAIREVPNFVDVLGIVASEVAHDEVSKSFEVAATELHMGIVASDADECPHLARPCGRCPIKTEAFDYQFVGPSG
ncbi:hypothetical protein ABLE92_22240, partial [Gordonia sp. VNQ95]